MAGKCCIDKFEINHSIHNSLNMINSSDEKSLLITNAYKPTGQPSANILLHGNKPSQESTMNRNQSINKSSKSPQKTHRTSRSYYSNTNDNNNQSDLNPAMNKVDFLSVPPDSRFDTHESKEIESNKYDANDNKNKHDLMNQLLQIPMKNSNDNNIKYQTSSTNKINLLDMNFDVDSLKVNTSNLLINKEPITFNFNQAGTNTISFKYLK